ncbi:hypothetical protein CL633_04505, partial [bacterium]|nr:hypothetical protein [bacterium]
DNYFKIGIEKTIYLQAIEGFIQDEMRRRKHFISITELQHQQTAKEIRIRGLIPVYASNSIYHIEGECTDLEEELLTFPKGLSDDVADATAYQLQLAGWAQGGILEGEEKRREIAPAPHIDQYGVMHEKPDTKKVFDYPQNKTEDWRT